MYTHVWREEKENEKERQRESEREMSLLNMYIGYTNQIPTSYFIDRIEKVKK